MISGALFPPDEQKSAIALQCKSGLVCEEYRSPSMSGPGNVFSCARYAGPSLSSVEEGSATCCGIQILLFLAERAIKWSPAGFAARGRPGTFLLDTGASV
ncbi:hypothetical protein TNCV_627101 [Trichonephila clavipes]|nr:hypothetical protein TNCV_627101 [Trichonephila clavipes]